VPSNAWPLFMNSFWPFRNVIAIAPPIQKVVPTILAMLLNLFTFICSNLRAQISRTYQQVRLDIRRGLQHVISLLVS